MNNGRGSSLTAAAISPSAARGRADPLTIDHPLAGVVVLVGLILAIIILPADVVPRGALRAPALLFIVSLCLVPAIAILRDPKSMFRAEHLLILSPAYWLLLDLLQGGYDLLGVEREAVQLSFIAIALFVAGSLIAFIQRPWRAPKFIWSAARAELPTNVCFGIGTMAFVLMFMKYAVPSGFDFAAMFQALQGGRWEGAWNRGAMGGTDAFLDHLSYFGYLLPPLTALLAQRLGWADRRPIMLGIGSLIMSAFVLHDGGRRLVGLLFGSGFVFWFLAKPKVKFSTILGLGLMMFGLLFTLERMLDYRDAGVTAMFDSDFAPERSNDDPNVLVRVDDNFLRLAQTTAIFPDRVPYTTWRYLLWVAVRPVPRLFWPGKPTTPGFDLPEFVGSTGASLSSSVIGELFMAGGLIGVALGGWFYGKLARALSYLLSEARTSAALLIYSIGLFAIFVGMRSMIELVLMSYVILGWTALLRLHAGFRSR